MDEDIRDGRRRERLSDPHYFPPVPGAEPLITGGMNVKSTTSVSQETSAS